MFKNNIFRIEVIYILINLFGSFVGFIRSYYIMKYLDFVELGLISLFQTVVMVISLFQFGLIYGGYRIYCQKDSSMNDKVNNNIHSFLLLLSATMIPVIIILKYYDIVPGPWELSIIGVTIGLFYVVKNWINNIFIAMGDFKALNIITLLSSLLGLVLVFLIPFWSYWASLISICVVPISFVAIAYFKYPRLIPKSLKIEISTLKYILSFGFIPFLAGIFGMFTTQIETWSITGIMGIDSLGRYYLPMIFSALFLLVPSSINSLFFPKCVKDFTEGNKVEFWKTIKKYTLTLILYSFIVTFLTLYLLEPIINYILPKHLIGVKYVYIILPGLIFKLLAEPIWLIFNSAVTLKPIFWANIFSVFFTILGVIILYYYLEFNLQNLSIVKSVIGLQILLFGLLGYLLLKYKIRYLIQKAL